MDKKSLIAAVAILVIIGGVVGIALAVQPANDTSDETHTMADGSQMSGEEMQVPDSDQDVAINDTSATITFTDQGFTPREITVKKGTKITVVNSSNTDVQFSSDEHPTHRDNPEMNLKTLAPGESASYTAETVGTHPFHDHIDESKTGTVIVTE